MLIMLLRNQRSFIIKILKIRIRKTIMKFININFTTRYLILLLTISNIILILTTSR